MILYHGTTMEIPIPRILRSEIGRDFGLAFYTTDIQEQAERWAKRKARINGKAFPVKYNICFHSDKLRRANPSFFH